MMKLRSWWVKTAVPLIHHHQLDLTSSLRCRQGDTHFFHVDLVFHKEGAEGRSVDMEEDVVMTRLKVGETACYFFLNHIPYMEHEEYEDMSSKSSCR
ncbi:hypothetical protein P8452_35094 [Trifolium repens]|nr:hypothetical protein P8452_35094 [Trifolium repens]